MKNRILYSGIAVLAFVLALSSCSKEDNFISQNSGEEVNVTMTTSLPQALQTYAVSSDKSGLANLEGQNLMVRYIMEVYEKGEPELVKRVICYKELNVDGDYKTASFNTRLIAAEYRFVFWADIVRKVTQLTVDKDLPGIDKTNGFYGNRYFISNLSEDRDELAYATGTDTYAEGSLLKVSTGQFGCEALQAINGEMNDAYTTKVNIDLRSASTVQNITLKRPFAKLRVIATDADLLQSQNLDVKNVVVSPSYSETIPESLNALTGETSGSFNLLFTCEKNAEYENENENEKTVGVYYCLIPSIVGDMTLRWGVTGSTQYAGVEVNVPNVPLVANKLTTIKGKLFGKTPQINVIIDDEFEGDETVVEANKEAANLEDLKASLTGKSESITYTGKVTKSNGFSIDFSAISVPAADAVANAAATTPLYAEGNTAELALKFTSIETGAVLTFEGGKNAPKILRITTGDTETSIRINLPATEVNYDGSNFKYIVTNAPRNNPYRLDLIYEALFHTGGGFYSGSGEDYEAHECDINSDFTLPENATCNAGEYHTSQPCTFIDTVKSWLSQEGNANKTVWNFVGEYTGN